MGGLDAERAAPEQWGWAIPLPLEPECAMSRFAPLAGLVLLAACGPSGPRAPETARMPVQDTIHGQVFTDDYRWLEDQDSPETRAWIAAQNDHAEAVIGESPERAWFRERLASFLDRDDVGGVRRAGDFEYFTMRRAGEEMPTLYRRPAGEEADADREGARKTSPPSTASTKSSWIPGTSIPHTALRSRPWSTVPKGGSWPIRCGKVGPTRSRSVSGNLETGRDLPDVLPRALYGGLEFTEDGESIYYTHRSREEGPRIRFHRFGTSMDEDRVVWGEDFGPTTYLNHSRLGDTGFRIFSAQHGWASNDLYLQEGDGPIRPVLVGSGAHLQTRFQDGRVWVRTDWEAPNYRLLSFDPRRPAPEGWTEVIGEGDHLLENYTFIDGLIYATYLEDVENRIQAFHPDGEPAEILSVPAGSSLSIRDGEDEGEVALTVVHHLQPSVTYSMDLESGNGRWTIRPTWTSTAPDSRWTRCGIRRGTAERPPSTSSAAQASSSTAATPPS